MSRLPHLAQRYALDVVIALFAIEGALEVALRSDAIAAPRTAHWFAVPAVAIVVTPFLARRSFPFAAPVAVWVLAVGLSLVDGRLVVFTSSGFAAGMLASYLLGKLDDDFQARVGLAAGLIASAIIVSDDPIHTTGTLIFIPTLYAMVWLAGYALRERSAQADAAEERAAQAEHDRETSARIAVAEERTRIARELHDVVAHAVSVMVLQVGAVRHNLPPSLKKDSDALRDVESAGRRALAEMRRLLGAMRDEGDDLELAPQPGLDSLDSLLDGVGRAGLPVQLHVEGQPFSLPRALDLSAYRIVQEGLTNALKHARATRADVTVRYGTDELQLEVRDDGVGTSNGDGLGHGLLGIRERVKIYGGEMTTGAATDGGFVLRTRLPLDRYES